LRLPLPFGPLAALPRSSASITEWISQQTAQLQPANSHDDVTVSFTQQLHVSWHPCTREALARAALGVMRVSNGDCYGIGEIGGAGFGISTPGAAVSVPWWG